MKRLLIAAFAVALTGCVSMPPASNYLLCDGIAKPQSAASQIGKLLTASSLIIPTQLPESSSPGQRKFGAAGVTACSAALAEGLVQENSLRYLNLIRARAVHHLENKNRTAALADLALIDQRIGQDKNDPSYARSFGLAVDLVRGIALIQSGDRPAGMAALQSAADRRPYALSLQTFLVDFINNADESDIEVAISTLERLIILSPNYHSLRAVIFDAKGVFPQQVAKDWEYLASNAVNPGSRSAGRPGAASEPIEKGLGAGIAYKDLSVLAHTALAQAHIGNIERARHWLDAANQHGAIISDFEAEVSNARQTNVEPVKERTSESRLARAKYRRTNKEISRAASLIQRHRVGQRNLKALTPFAEAWIALHKEGVVAAAEILTPLSEVPRSNAVYDLIARIQDGVPEDRRSNIIAMDIPTSKQRWYEATLSGLETGNVSQNAFDTNFYFARSGMASGGYSRLYGLVPLTEMTSRRNNFSGQAVFFKPTGFKDKTTKQGSQIIEFMGDNSSRAQVEEMTILRAAVLAQDAGKDGLIILSFTNYNRMVTQTYNGRPVGAPTLAGYKTELETLFVDRKQAKIDHSEDADRIIAVDDVMAKLAPIYTGGEE